MPRIQWDNTLLARAGDLEWASRVLVEGFLQGLHRSPLLGFSAEFADRKPYSQGDDTRFLDWQCYGRTDRFYIRRFESETNLTAQIILDGSGSMGYSSRHAPLSKYGFAAMMCAGLLRLLLRRNDACGLSIIGGEGVAAHSRPKLGRLHFERCLALMESHLPAGEASLAKELHPILHGLRNRSLIILITDALEDTGPLEQALAGTTGSHHEVHLWRILDERELDFDLDGGCILEDLETGVRLPVHPAAVRKDYLEAMQAHGLAIRNLCHAHQIYLHETVTSEEPFPALRSILAPG